jgi:hypothetical protein
MYETGTATGVVDLITKLEAFMALNGWTTDSFATEGSGKRYHAHNGGVFFNARAYNVETPSGSIQNGGTTGVSSLAFNLSTAGTGGSAWFDKTGAPSRSGTYMTAGLNGITGAIAKYHFFAQNSGEAIAVIVEHVAGYYQMFQFGTLAKYGSYTGGQYMSGSLTGVEPDVVIFNGRIPGVGFITKTQSQGSPALVSVSVDSETGWHWTDTFNLNQDTTKRYARDNFDRYVNSLAAQPNTLNGLAVLTPVVVSIDRGVTRDRNTDRCSPLGEIPGAFFVRLTNLTAGQQITLGSTDYRVFPFYHKNEGASTPSLTAFHSSYYGFAIAE